MTDTFGYTNKQRDKADFEDDLNEIARELLNREKYPNVKLVDEVTDNIFTDGGELKVSYLKKEHGYFFHIFLHSPFLNVPFDEIRLPTPYNNAQYWVEITQDKFLPYLNERLKEMKKLQKDLKKN